MNIAQRITRHARLSLQASRVGGAPSPPFLILFINSICNLTCEHCFYWQNLNQRDDLTTEEMFSLSDQLGRVENLNLSGGEPFIRPEFAEICRKFIRDNGVKNIYVPTNGYFTEKTVNAVTGVLEESDLQIFALEFSLDGMPEYHNQFRGNDQSFEKAMETYDAMVEVQKKDPRLRIHAISTVTSENVAEIRALTEMLYERCPDMEHHNLALIRGDRKNPSLQGPDLAAYEELHAHAQRLWAPRERGRFGATVEPMLQWAKVRTAREQTQVVPCKAGMLSAVVHANGDVSMCETHEPLGNLRQNSFAELWHSEAAEKLRHSIRCKECYCTNEIFLWPSITYQPRQLARALVASEAWKRDPAARKANREVVRLPALKS